MSIVAGFTKRLCICVSCQEERGCHSTHSIERCEVTGKQSEGTELHSVNYCYVNIQFLPHILLRAMQILFSPMVSGWVGKWTGGQAA